MVATTLEIFNLVRCDEKREGCRRDGDFTEWRVRRLGRNERIRLKKRTEEGSKNKQEGEEKEGESRNARVRMKQRTEEGPLEKREKKKEDEEKTKRRRRTAKENVRKSK